MSNYLGNFNQFFWFSALQLRCKPGKAKQLAEIHFCEVKDGVLSAWFIK